MTKNNLDAMRHSCEHVLTMAMMRLWPGKIKAAMGPTIEEGFYFDFDSKIKISEDDFKKIEGEMKKIINQDLPIIKDEMTVKEARKFFSNNTYKGNKYKHEWLDEIEARGENVSVYFMGKKGQDMPSTFVDICSGPHVVSTKKIGPFRLTSIAGAYWRGDEKNKMLQRIYGTCFETKNELEKYLKMLEEAGKRDHRELGKRLELFMFDDEVGAGLPLWLPKGALLMRLIKEFAFNTYLNNGYDPVSSPHIALTKLFSHSGHLDFYKENLYSPFKIENEHYMVKPMNCPFHVKMYKSKMHSYRDLPIRWTEMGTVYRYERSGVLHGLTRVRCFTQDDAHIICTDDQISKELSKAIKLTKYILNSFGFSKFEVNLSTRDPKKKKDYIGTDVGWKKAEDALKSALIKSGFKDFVYDVGGAVFYGPKIDIKISDALGRAWQLSTIQIDFNLPERFDMVYIDKAGKEVIPFMIHRALLGSLERFIGVLIEHYAGAFPVWLSPVQVKIISIGKEHIKYGNEVMKKLIDMQIRVELDDRNETIGKKIREAEIQKIPYLLIVGDKEKASNSVAVREREKGNLGAVKIDKFISTILDKISKKS